MFRKPNTICKTEEPLFRKPYKRISLMTLPTDTKALPATKKILSLMDRSMVTVKISNRKRKPKVKKEPALKKLKCESIASDKNIDGSNTKDDEKTERKILTSVVEQDSKDINENFDEKKRLLFTINEEDNHVFELIVENGGEKLYQEKFVGFSTLSIIINKLGRKN